MGLSLDTVILNSRSDNSFSVAQTVNQKPPKDGFSPLKMYRNGFGTFTRVILNSRSGNSFSIAQTVEKHEPKSSKRLLFPTTNESRSEVEREYPRISTIFYKKDSCEPKSGKSQIFPNISSCVTKFNYVEVLCKCFRQEQLVFRSKTFLTLSIDTLHTVNSPIES